MSEERFIASRFACGMEVHDHVVRHTAGLAQIPVIDQISVGRDSLMHMVAMDFGVGLVTGFQGQGAIDGVVFRPMTSSNNKVGFSAMWSSHADNPAARQFISLAHVMARRTRKGTSDWTRRTP